MKHAFSQHARKILTFVSFSAVAVYPALPSANVTTPNHASPDEISTDDPLDAPARAPKTDVADPSRINRKPAVEPRVYMESVNSKTGFVYFDYADQKPTTDPARIQHPPDQEN
jgi:hypothetical protein